MKIAKEENYDFKFNDGLHIKLSISPRDLRELAIGHGFTESLINNLKDINSLEINKNKYKKEINLKTKKTSLI